jgi:hypothetical protein
MGLFDSLKNVLSGSGTTTEPVELEPGEHEVTRVVACTVKGAGRAWVGGDLVLTDRRLLFTPLNVQDVAALLTYGLKKAGAPAQAGLVVGWMAAQAKQQAVSASLIGAVEPTRSAGLLNPPTMTVHLNDGSSLEFGVLHSRRSINTSHDNVLTRDSFIDAVRGQITK